MLSEYQELISRLKATDQRFHHLFNKHTELDQKIRNMEAYIESGSHEEIDMLKKKKLLLKDEIYILLKKAEHG